MNNILSIVLGTSDIIIFVTYNKIRQWASINGSKQFWAAVPCRYICQLKNKFYIPKEIPGLTKFDYMRYLMSATSQEVDFEQFVEIVKVDVFAKR